MCKYMDLANGTCKINNDICPYLYFCNKEKKYKSHNSAPIDCKVKRSIEVPRGFYKVEFERRHRLYILVDNEIEIVANPYDYVPLYVKMTKLKSGKWKIKQAVG